MRLLKILSLPLLLIASLIGFDRAGAQEEPSLSALEFEEAGAAAIFSVPPGAGALALLCQGPGAQARAMEKSPI